MAKNHITYVLAGDDPTNAFKDQVATYKARGDSVHDVVVITPREGESAAQAVKRVVHASSDTDVNVVIASHGGQGGTIAWNKGESAAYSDIFKALPRNGSVTSVSVASCFGESAENSVNDLPKGAVLQSLVGSKVYSYGDFGHQFTKETIGVTSQADIMIKALDNIDPVALSERIVRQNEKDKKEWIEVRKLDPKDFQPVSTNPRDVLPHTIGIGGHQSLNLDKEVDAIVNNKKNGKPLDDAAYAAAITKVQHLFDTNNGMRGHQGAAAEKALDDRVAQVAEKMKQGQALKSIDTPEGIEERRISYALAIGYLDTSKELEHRINRAKGIEEHPKPVIKEAPPRHDEPTHPAEPVHKDGPKAVTKSPPPPTPPPPQPKTNGHSADNHAHPREQLHFSKKDQLEQEVMLAASAALHVDVKAILTRSGEKIAADGLRGDDTKEAERQIKAALGGGVNTVEDMMAKLAAKVPEVAKLLKDHGVSGGDHVDGHGGTAVTGSAKTRQDGKTTGH